jgi:hypothetical protein
MTGGVFLNMANLAAETQRVVIFDTNAYRKLCGNEDLTACKAKVRQILIAEKSYKTEALANLYTIMELAAHLADGTDPHYDQCLNALVALGIHTQIDNGIKTFADSASTVCRELFGMVHPEHQKVHDRMTSLAAHVRDNAPDLSDSILHDNLIKICAIVEGIERWWIDRMKSVIAQYDPDGAKTWELGKGDKSHQKKLRLIFASEKYLQTYAAIHVIYYASMVNVHLENAALSEKTKQYLKAFGTPLRLMLKVWEKIATTGGYTLEHHKEKRGNYVWDFSIAYAVGMSKLGNADMFVVTGDKQIKEAATEAGCGQRVMNLNEYLTSVGMSL